MWNLQNIQSFVVKHGEGSAELSASFARTSTRFEYSFLKEKSKFPLAYTKTDEVLALEELLCGVCSVRTVLSLLRTPENPTHLLCVVGWPASTLGPAGALKGGEFWKCIFLGIFASQGDLSTGSFRLPCTDLGEDVALSGDLIQHWNCCSCCSGSWWLLGWGQQISLGQNSYCYPVLDIS